MLGVSGAPETELLVRVTLFSKLLIEPHEETISGLQVEPVGARIDPGADQVRDFCHAQLSASKTYPLGWLPVMIRTFPLPENRSSTWSVGPATDGTHHQNDGGYCSQIDHHDP